MSASTVSKSLQNRSLVLRVFTLGLEISMRDIKDRIKEMSGEDVCINTLHITILDLIKENFLAYKNGPPYPSRPEERSGEGSRGRIKLFSLKPAV
ncbi:hypothetical protein IID26_02665 [Patescibacteria group bacterium]|nr:hypothetical protein [Patescibacteria group bacterium]